ncbi:MAG TPA: alpha/beta hydrolase, partial [Holophagaceae bacterium]|nr:alpha/beta hydrolase [Holophagaceae bacterium]
DGAWTRHDLRGAQGAPLELWWLHRPRPRGLALLLHGFGDDAWGMAPLARSLPEWDVAVFTFRGRDRHSEVFSTLGAHERADVAAVVGLAEAGGVPRGRLILVASSQGAGTALLALADLDPGGPLGGALLEAPFRDLREAARNHLRGTLGRLEPLTRLAQAVALARAGRLAGFDPDTVSPLAAAPRVHTPVALLTGDADPVTPIEGVRAIARALPDLTIVPGAGHCEAGSRVPGGWRAWAESRLHRWNLMGP